MAEIDHIDQDFVAPFQIADQPVRGRITRLGPKSLDPILKRHDYPDQAAFILGEALCLAVLTGASLKFEGCVSVQAEGDGAVNLMVAEYRTEGHIRAYMRRNQPKWDRLERVNKGARAHMPQLFGQAALSLSLIQKDSKAMPYRGIVPVEKAELAQCAQSYFEHSEQIPTRLKLGVAKIEIPNQEPQWCGSGILLQKIAEDEMRGKTDEDWETATALFETIRIDELVDPNLAPSQLLYRLFHESGVYMEAGQNLIDACTCSSEKVKASLTNMPRESVAELLDEDGGLTADCQFCGRQYQLSARDLPA